MIPRTAHARLANVVRTCLLAAALLPVVASAETVAWDWGGPPDISEPPLDAKVDNGVKPDTPDVWTPSGSVQTWGLPNACWYKACSTERVTCFQTEGCKELMACSKSLQETTCVGNFSMAAKDAHAAYMTCGKNTCGPVDFTSCSGRCGTYYGSWVTCECDSACVVRKDCCADFATCPPAADVAIDLGVDSAPDVAPEPDVAVDGTDREVSDTPGVGGDVAAADDLGPVRQVADNACQAQRGATGADKAALLLAGVAAWIVVRRRAVVRVADDSGAAGQARAGG